MFKSTKVIAAALIVAALAACGGQAQAQVLTETFKAGGSTFSTAEIRSFQGVAGGIVITDKGGAVFPSSDFPDSTGAVYTKLTASADVLKYYYQVPGTSFWINTRQILRSFCNNGRSSIIWIYGSNQDLDTTCNIASGIAARAN